MRRLVVAIFLVLRLVIFLVWCSVCNSVRMNRAATVLHASSLSRRNRRVAEVVQSTTFRSELFRRAYSDGKARQDTPARHLLDLSFTGAFGEVRIELRLDAYFRYLTMATRRCSHSKRLQLDSFSAATINLTEMALTRPSSPLQDTHIGRAEDVSLLSPNAGLSTTYSFHPLTFTSEDMTKEKGPHLDVVLEQNCVFLKGTGVDADSAYLSGQVALTLTEPTSLKEITLQFRGKARLPVPASES